MASATRHWQRELSHPTYSGERKTMTHIILADINAQRLLSQKKLSPELKEKADYHYSRPYERERNKM